MLANILEKRINKFQPNGFGTFGYNLGFIMRTFFLIGMVFGAGLCAEAQVLFTLSSSPTVGSTPRGIAAADLNGDRTLDIVTVSGANDSLSVMTNNGNGRFSLSSSPAIGNNSNPVLAVDVNGDGKVDLICASYSLSSLSILTNDGSGGFVRSSSLGTGRYPLWIAAADMSGDGNSDIIVPNSGDATVIVLTNNGIGKFGTNGIYPVGFNPIAICATDVNGDRKLDIVTANYGGNSISVLTNDGFGKYLAAGTYSGFFNPMDIVAADINGDGSQDLICANYGGNSVSVLTNNGSGAFVSAGNYSVGSGPYYLVSADVNGDHWPDVVTANYNSSSITVLTNDGMGKLASAGAFAVGSHPFSVVAADVNNDGRVDLVTANGGSGTISVLTNSTQFLSPTITIQPTNTFAYVGTTVTMSVTALGASPLIYQWMFNGTNIVGAAGSALVLSNIQLSQAGNYSVLVANLYGSTTSSIAVLSVSNLPPCVPPPSSMVAWWKAEGTAADVAGNLNGQLVGGLGFGSGEVGLGFRFVDTNGYVMVPATTGLNVGTNIGFTVEAWIMPSNTSKPMPLFGWGTNLAADTVGSNILAGPILNTNNGHFYFLLDSNTWTASEAEAEALGGHLVTIRNPSEGLWVSNMFANFGGVARNLWIGLYDPSHDSVGDHPDNFVWVSGETASYRSWSGGEPNDCGYQEFWCLILAPDPIVSGVGAGLWNDVTNTAANCGSPGSSVVYGVVETASVGHPFIWTSVGQTGSVWSDLLDTTNGSHAMFSAAGVIQSNVYQHVAFTYDTSTGIGALYVNGAAVATTNLGSFVPQTTGDFYIGKRIDGSPADIFSGGMDEVTLYQRALSSLEIQGIYQAANVGKCLAPQSPIIIAQPTNQIAAEFTTAILVVGAVGSAPLAYQWRLNGTNLFAMTNSILVLPDLKLTDSGTYDVVVTNFVGSVTSAPAVLDVKFIVVTVNGRAAAGAVGSTAPATVGLFGGYPAGYLFFTLDGSVPTMNSLLYTGPFLLTNSATVRVLSLSEDFSRNGEGLPVTINILPTFNVQISTLGAGTVVLNPPNGPYLSNSVVSLSATASPHWRFDHWGGDVSGVQNPIDLTVDGPGNVQAVFVQTEFPLTLNTPGGGLVATNGRQILAPNYFPAGSSVSISAVALDGWRFLYWRGTINGTNAALDVVMDQTNNIQGVFGTMANTNAIGGQVVLGQPNPIPFGTLLAVSALPDTGNYFVAWNGVLAGTNAPLRFMVTNANPNFGALFAPTPSGRLSLSVIILGNGTTTQSPAGNLFNFGDVVTVTAANDADSAFLGWSRDGVGNGNPLVLQLSTNTVVQANFGSTPVVTIAPENSTVFAGDDLAIDANALASQPFGYQWFSLSGAVHDATNSIFRISNVQPTNAGQYWVVVSNSTGVATSDVAMVTVIGVPVITNQPDSATVMVGHPASFAVGAFGWPKPAYQWRLDGANVAGATNAVLSFPNAFPENAGTYTVAITNFYGSLTSAPAMLTVLPLDILMPSGLVNGHLQFTFDTANGMNYEVQYSTNLTDWFPWLDLYGNGQPFTLRDPSTEGFGQRFYRVVLTPQ